MSYAHEMARERARSAQLLDEMDAIHELRTRTANLSACLAIAGALCRAWELGNDAFPLDFDAWVDASETHIARVGSWFPGCGRKVER